MQRLLLALVTSMTFSSQPCHARVTPFGNSATKASDLHFINAIMATKPNDRSLYILLGGGFMRTLTAGDPKAFISGWVKAHPNAVATGICSMISTNRVTHEPSQIIYIWLEDGRESLNVDLTRAGIFPGGTMFDMVYTQKNLDEMLKHDPVLAGARAEIEKEVAAFPQDQPIRLIPESAYRARMLRIEKAEREAKAEKRGIWSDAMKEEREAQGVE